jgi:hypothetical protein
VPPVATPLVLMEAIAALLVLQVPPAMELVNVVVRPEHNVEAPTTGAVGLTLTA